MSRPWNGIRFILLAGILIFSAAPASAAEPLVGVDWVVAHIGKPGIAFLDLRSKRDYITGHVPGAVHSDYERDGWRITDARGTPGMLPPPDQLAEKIGKLGIGNETHVVLLAEGLSSYDMGAAARVYWTFKVLGHDQLSILNGGMDAYIKWDPKTRRPVYPLERGDHPVPAKVFKVDFHPGMVATRDDVRAALASGGMLIDNRQSEQFLGVSKSGSVARPGTLPGAKDLPHTWMTTNDHGFFRPRAQIEVLYAAAGVPTTGPQIMFCNTGHRSTIGWFVSHELLGNTQVRIYDGSMAEWTEDPKAPVVARISLP